MVRRHPALRGIWTILVIVPLVLPLGFSLAAGRPGSSALRPVSGAAPAAELVPRPDLHPALVEVRSREAGPRRLLAVAPDGRAAATAHGSDPAGARLSVARLHASPLGPQLPGILDAGFAADGTWLAAIDGAGAMWRIPADSAAPSVVTGGPFVGPVSVEPGGAILASRVPSLEAPHRSRLSRIGPGGIATVISTESLVYGSARLADGTIAVVAHRPTGTVVLRLAARGSVLVADLGLGAVNVSLAADGRRLAFERAGEVHLLDVGSGVDRRVGSGTRPRLAPDGRALLVDRDGRTVVLADDGSLIADLGHSVAGFAACPGEGCQP
jgi:hypothetical protein